MSSLKSILYIDDEADLLDLAASFFEEEGLPIDTASDYHQALGMIRKRTYDLIISDARMPSGSGPELLAVIRKEKIFEGKFLLVTGNIEGIHQSKLADCDEIIFKPVRFEELVQKAKRHLNIELE